jgi:hypothetical protein
MVPVGFKCHIPLTLVSGVARASLIRALPSLP